CFWLWVVGFAFLFFGFFAPPLPLTAVVTDEPCAPVLLPVPGSSRTSPLLHIPACLLKTNEAPDELTLEEI
ncbi:hypothetical protein VSS95_31715, partial [Pseudomonas syringae pv. tagetis]